MWQAIGKAVELDLGHMYATDRDGRVHDNISNLLQDARVKVKYD